MGKHPKKTDPDDPMGGFFAGNFTATTFQKTHALEQRVSGFSPFSPKGKEVFDLLVNSGYMVDWREPDVIRFAPVPLYNSFSEVWNFFDQLKVVLGQVFSEENHKNLDNE